MSQIEEARISMTEYYFCLTHHTVEPYEGCRSADRLGPYPTKDEASHALEKAEHRNEEWENDPRWNDDEEADEDEDDSDGWGPFKH